MASNFAVGMIETVLSIFSVVELVLLGMTFFYLAKAAGAAAKGISGHESTQAAGEHVRRWGRNLSKKDEKIWNYNKIANKLVVDMKRGDDDIERRLNVIKESLEELRKVDENPDFVPEGGLIQ